MSALQEFTGRAIIVLGMHRSGTSMLVRCIHLLGAEIAQQVIPTDAAINRDGFFEDAKVVALNDKLLSMLGICWYDFQPLAHQATDSQNMKLWQKQALAHVQEEYAGQSLSAIKDPRMSRLWIFWAPIFELAGLRVDLVHIVRSPEHVAMSLKRRNGMPLAYGLLLWTAHIIDILNVEDNAASRTTLFYDSFLSDPHTNIKLIVALLGSAIAATPDYAYIEGEIGEPRSSVSPSNGAELTLIQDLYVFASQLYQSLENHCAAGKLELAANEIERLNNEYRQLLSRYEVAFETLRVLTNELIAVNGELVKIGEQHSTAQTVVAERDGQLAVLNGELKRVGAELEYAQSVVTERDGQLVELNAERDAQVAALNEELTRYENVWFRRLVRFIRRPFL